MLSLVDSGTVPVGKTFSSKGDGSGAVQNPPETAIGSPVTPQRELSRTYKDHHTLYPISFESGAVAVLSLRRLSLMARAELIAKWQHFHDLHKKITLSGKNLENAPVIIHTPMNLSNREQVECCQTFDLDLLQVFMMA